MSKTKSKKSKPKAHVTKQKFILYKNSKKLNNSVDNKIIKNNRKKSSSKTKLIPKKRNLYSDKISSYSYKRTRSRDKSIENQKNQKNIHNLKTINKNKNILKKNLISNKNNKNDKN